MKVHFAAIVVALLALTCAAVAQAPYTVVVGNLNSPRGITFGPSGRLYIAQAGTGANDGKISEYRLSTGVLRDIVTGLPSIVAEGNPLGVSGISTHSNGSIYAVTGLSPAETGVSSFGELFKLNLAGSIKGVNNIGSFDYAWTQDHVSLAPHDFPDANPYGVLVDGGTIYVADAASNTINRVRPDGSIEIIAYIPNNVIADATPTCIAKGPDGALYVGTLALRDSLAFGARADVYRIDPRLATGGDLASILGAASLWATGLWPINGCTFTPDGTFYASQLFTTQQFTGGDVVKIPFSDPSTHTYMTGGTLPFPAGVAVGPDGGVYVAIGTAFIPQGAVVRLNSN